MKLITIDIEFAGETRTVEARLNESTRVAFVSGFVAQIGAGSARYPATAPCTQDPSGEWRVGRHVIVRNRSARLVGWADVVAATNSVDQTRA